MPNASPSLSRPARAASDTGPVEHRRAAPGATGIRGDGWFVDMLDAYRGSGGLVRADEIVALFDLRGGPGVAALGRWMAEGRIIGFAWASDTWLPLFQFDRADMRPKGGLQRPLAELAPVCDAWELADWFARPNAWLAERAPVGLLDSHPDAVLQAARADRFVVRW